MAARKLTVGLTLGEALSFTVSNFHKIIGMTWISLILMLAVILAGVFWMVGLDREALVELGTAFEEILQEDWDEEWSEDWTTTDEIRRWQAETDDEATKPTANSEPDSTSPTDEKPPVDADGEKPGADANEETSFDNPFADLPDIETSRILIGAPVIILLVLILQAVPIVGYTRTQLRGKAPILWPFYFRLGPAEIRLTVTIMIMTTIMLVASVLLLVPVGLLFGIAGAAATVGEDGNASPGLIIAVIFGTFLLFLCVLPWLWSRMALAIPISVAEGGLGIGRAWRASAGYGLPLTLSFILGFFLVVFVTSTAQVLVNAALLPFDIAPGEEPIASAPVLAGVGAVVLFLLIAMQAFQNAVLYGIFTAAYKHLRTDEAA